MTPKPKKAQSTPSDTGHVVSMETMFSGPLPPPSILKGYDDACPGASERIIRMAEDQGLHRRKMEELAASTAIEDMRHDYGEAKRGQIFGLTVVLCMIAGGVSIALLGHPWPGALLGSSGVGLQIVNTFVRGRKGNNPESDAMRQAIPSMQVNAKR